MKSLPKIALLAAGLVIAFLAARAFLRSTPSPVLSGPAKGFAVIELFTSEGCSSCPPADQLVARIQQAAKDEPVYILAFHVDYWDRLGWKDGFSDARYTERQRRYASWLHLESVYTPQIVVNGQKEFVGSQENTLRDAITSSLGQAPRAPAPQLTLSGVRLDGGKVHYHYDFHYPYHVTATGGPQSLVVALVQRSASTDVKAGENSGRTLSHVQIVRNISSTGLGMGSGAGTLDVPQGLTGGTELIAFVQYDDDGQIVAATGSVIP